METESPSRETIGIKLEVLETIENQLRDANVQVMNLMLEDETISPPDLEKEQDMVVQYEESFVRTKRRVAKYLQVRETGQQGRDTLDPAGSAQEGMPSCKLPKMALPVFDGTCLEWMGWWSRFEMIHESAVLTEVEKFQYLVQSMKAGTRADRLVKSYPLTTENYPKVVKALQDRFGDKVILTEVYVRQLLKLVINNARKKTLTLEGLYDQVESHLRALESLGVTTQQNASFLYPLVESSLPEDLLRIWQRSALAGYGGDELELPITIDQRLERLLEFLRREVKGDQRLEYMKEGFGESSQRRNYGQHIARMHAAQITEAKGRATPLCLRCKGKHWIQDCAGWRSMTVTERRGEIRKFNACFRCLRVGHVMATCRTQFRCSHCKGFHHAALHLPRRVSMEDQDQRERQNTEEPRISPGEQEIALSGMHVRTAIPTALLATARVRLVGPRGVGVTVRALLDQGSQSSFVHRDLLHHLNIPVHKVNAQIYGINDTKGEHVKQMVSCSVASLTESGWTIPIRALVVGRMTGILPSRDLRIPVPSSWKTLPLADPQFETSGRVDVILGADVYGSLLLPEVKYDEKTQLCAQKTRLGWIVSGKLPGEGDVGPHRVYNIRVNYEENLDNVLRRFWEVEEVPLRPAKSDADEFCEELYKTKTTKFYRIAKELITRNPHIVTEQITRSPHIVTEQITKSPHIVTEQITRSPHIVTEQITKSSHIVTEQITKSPHIVTKQIARSPHIVTEQITRSPHIVTEQITRSPHIVTEQITRSPHIVTEQITKSPHIVTEQITRSPHIVTEQITRSPHIVTEQITRSPHIVTEQITRSPHIVTEQITRSPHNVTEQITRSPHIVTEQITRNPHIVTEQITKSPHIVTEQITKSPHIVTEQITRSPHIVTEQITRSPHNVTEQITRSPHIVKEQTTKSPHIVTEQITRSPHIVTEQITRSPHNVTEQITRSPHIVKEQITRSPHIVTEQITRSPDLVTEQITKVV
ncbi:hypothetical protein LAZ67_10004052 [Cordylochernes scorpioides]|uniref:Peptidase aspartic putative domain-containing protein n=1 Tax=Cordylochernes scorpioides TaxID=51811 RepID=A0ABY6KXB3_9ARAC|nr:hypothetical protein LAZ67_10004052 [Cordylochernes scorpioides]